MNYTIAMIFSFSIAIAAITGWVRFKEMDPAFLPFLLLVTLATCNELISALVINVFHRSNAVNANIYSLIEALMIAWQFKRWKLFDRAYEFSIIFLLFIIVWTIENVFIFSIRHFSSYFNILYGFATVMMSINMVNRLLLYIHPQQFTRSILLICFAFILFYTYTAFIEIFWIWGVQASKVFRRDVYRILCYINLLTNLAYALAILWVPRKRKFMQLC